MTSPPITIPEDELAFTFIRADGPGGQNVNKVASAVQLRFDLNNSRTLPDEVKQRLVRLAGKRMTDDGVLIIEARRYREQERNRRDAIERLHHLVEKAVNPPAKRVPTRPTAGSVLTRLEAKKRRAETKRKRNKMNNEWE